MNRKTTIALILGLALGLRAQAELLQDVFERTIPVAPDVTFSVRNTDGTIYLYGAKEPRIKITARKRSYSKSRLDEISINITNDGNRVSIDTVYPKNPKGLSVADRSGTVDYLILIPETATVAQAELGSGEVIVDGMRGGGLDTGLTNGRMTLRNCFCDVRAAVETGGLDLYYTWWEALRFVVAGKVENGNVRAQLPQGAALRFDAASGNGRVMNFLTSEGAGRGPAPALKTEIGAGAEMELRLRAERGNVDLEKGY